MEITCTRTAWEVRFISIGKGNIKNGERGYQDWELGCYQYWEGNNRNGKRLENQDWEGMEEDTRIGKRTPGLKNVGKDWEGDTRIGMRENQDCEGSTVPVSGLGYQDCIERYQGLCRHISELGGIYHNGEGNMRLGWELQGLGRGHQRRK
jgi:hypothetical protein